MPTRNKPSRVRTCKHCKCTDRNACVGGPLGTCAWVTRNECSACRPDLLERMLAAAGRRVPGKHAGKKRKKKMNNEAQTQTAEETTALPLRGDDQAEAAPTAAGQETQDSLDVEADAPDAPAAEGVSGEV